MWVDDRAGSRDLMAYEPVKSTGSLCTLDGADVMLIGNGPNNTDLTVGVEVKSVHDLISSMNTGRLQATQLPALLEHYDVPWLLWYGSVRAGDEGQLEILRGRYWRTFKLGQRPVPYGYLHAFLFDLTAVGVRVAHVYNIEEAAAWLGVLHRWWTKPWEKHKGLKALDRSREVSLMPNLTPEEEVMVRVASQLPGVGFEKAQSAAGHFTSVVNMVCAPTQEWEKVPGIGKVIAKAVVDIMRRDK